MARPGYFLLVPVALLCVLAWIVLPRPWQGLIAGTLLLVELLLLNFYRDPERVGPPETEQGLVLSPADGRVVAVQASQGELFISIFLSPLDVHVNRAPVAGRVVKITRTHGRFLPAFKEEASTQNERVKLEFDSADVGRVGCTQVAGLLARRIQNWIEEGQVLSRGERYGMIHLGSRVDLELSLPCEARVKPGDRVTGGVTVLAVRVVG